MLEVGRRQQRLGRNRERQVDAKIHDQQTVVPVFRKKPDHERLWTDDGAIDFADTGGQYNVPPPQRDEIPMQREMGCVGFAFRPIKP